MEFVYAASSDKLAGLKKILEEEPYAKDSFASVGYVLKESSAVGLKGGRYVVFFKAGEQAVAAKLKGRLARVEGGVEELTGGDKQTVVDAINTQEENASAGFGSIFG